MEKPSAGASGFGSFLANLALEPSDMTDASKTQSNSEAEFNFATFAKEFATMKHDIAAIAAKFATSTGNGAAGALHGAADDLSERATGLYENLSAQGKRAVGAVSHQVEEQPLVSVLVAFAVGFVASKLLSRSL